VRVIGRTTRMLVSRGLLEEPDPEDALAHLQAESVPNAAVTSMSTGRFTNARNSDAITSPASRTHRSRLNPHAIGSRRDDDRPGDARHARAQALRESTLPGPGGARPRERPGRAPAQAPVPRGSG
jgi:hypothetical protein